MEDHILKRAAIDIKLIKDAINKTTDSFILLGKVFIGWGLTFTIASISIILLHLFRLKINETIKNYPLLGLLPFLIIAAIALAVYLIKSKSKALKGLSKSVLMIWLAIIAFIVMQQVFEYLSFLFVYGVNTEYDALSVSLSSFTNTSTLLLTFAFGILCIRLFTNLKFAGWMSFIYALLALINIIFRDMHIGYIIQKKIAPPMEIYSMFDLILYCVILQLTFLILGGYLEFKRIRRG